MVGGWPKRLLETDSFALDKCDWRPGVSLYSLFDCSLGFLFLHLARHARVDTTPQGIGPLDRSTFLASCGGPPGKKKT